MNKFNFHVASLISLCLSLAWVLLGCRTSSPVTSDPSVSDESAPPEFDVSDYRIEPNDSINIMVFDVPELGMQNVQVTAGGTIDYYYFKGVRVQGMTLGQIATMLQEKLEEGYLVDPQVQVTIARYRPRSVTVIGEVNRPGVVSFEMEKPMDILEAIAAAGGLSPRASKNKIVLSREGVDQTYSYDRMIKASAVERVWLRPGDIISVGESFF